MNKKISNILASILFCVFPYITNCYANDANEWGVKTPTEISVNNNKFWFMEDSNTQLIHIIIGFKYSGSAYQSIDKISVPALFAFSMLCGAGKYSTVKLKNKISELSLSINTQVSLDNFYISISMPLINKDEGIQLIMDILGNPKFEENEVKKIQQSAYGLQDYADNPAGCIASTLAPAIIFKDHPYNRGTYGTTENMLKLSIDDLRNFHKNFLTQKNCVCYIGGNISQNDATELFEKITKALSQGNIADEVKNTEVKLNNSIVNYYADGTQTTIAFVLKNVPTNSKQRYAARLLFRILGENYCFKGRILSILRSQKGLIYSGGVRLYDANHSNYAIGYLWVANNKVNESIKVTKEILADLCNKGITQEELDFAKSNYIGTLATQLRSSLNLSLFFFANHLVGKPISCLNDTLLEIEKVALNDVNTLAKNLFKDVTFIVIGGAK